MKGTTLIKIGGKERPIKFGTNQSSKYCEVRSVSLAEMQDELSDISKNTGSEIRDLIFSALWAGAKSDKLEVDFDYIEVGDWIDEMDQGELNKCFQVLVNSNDSGGGSEEGADEKK